MNKMCSKPSKKASLIFNFMTKKELGAIFVVCTIMTAWLYWLLIMIRRIIV